MCIRDRHVRLQQLQRRRPRLWLSYRHSLLEARPSLQILHTGVLKSPASQVLRKHCRDLPGYTRSMNCSICELHSLHEHTGLYIPTSTDNMAHLPDLRIVPGHSIHDEGSCHGQHGLEGRRPWACGTGPECPAVSYTHLDVYKRQAIFYRTLGTLPIN